MGEAGEVAEVRILGLELDVNDWMCVFHDAAKTARAARVVLYVSGRDSDSSDKTCVVCEQCRSRLLVWQAMKSLMDMLLVPRSEQMRCSSSHVTRTYDLKITLPVPESTIPFRTLFCRD